MLIGSIKHTLTLISIILIFGGCQSKSGVEVIIKFIYIPTSDNASLHYINVISGVDKFHWYDITPNETVGITLYPGDKSDTQITLFYQLSTNSSKQFWEGPKHQIGKSYRIHIAFYENGDIKERSCDLPCNLN